MTSYGVVTASPVGFVVIVQLPAGNPVGRASIITTSLATLSPMLLTTMENSIIPPGLTVAFFGDFTVWISVQSTSNEPVSTFGRDSSVTGNSFPPDTVAVFSIEPQSSVLTSRLIVIVT